MTNELQHNREIESFSEIKDSISQYLYEVGPTFIKLRMREDKLNDIDFNHPTFKRFFSGWNIQRDENLNSFAPPEILTEWHIFTLDYNSEMKAALRHIYPFNP